MVFRGGELMSANTRKPVCPACHGFGGWGATHFQPDETCETCGGSGHVNKRTAARLRKLYARQRVVIAQPLVITTGGNPDDIPF